MYTDGQRTFTYLDQDQVRKLDSIEGGNSTRILALLMESALAVSAGELALASGSILVGNASGVAAAVAMSGQATIDNAGAVTLANSAVIAKVLTGFVAGAGAVAATDSILAAVQKLAGNSQNLAIINNLLTGYVAGTQGAVSALAATDSILAAIQKLDGNKPSYVESTFEATFDQSVGAKTVVARKIGKLVTLEIPTGSTADGGGAAIASGATDVPAGYRPAADLSVPVVVTENAAKVFGRLVITAAGQLVFTSSAAGAVFTDDAVAGFDRCSVTFSVA